jgi:hypothetical protein
MSIKPSAAAEIRALVATLSAADPVKRESAIARLAVIGPRAIDRLLTTYSAPATDDDTRVAILRVFDAIADPRALPVIRVALAGSTAVASAAVAALRGLLNSVSEETSTDALDLLVALVADPEAGRALRLAAYEALREMPADVQARLAEALASDPDPVVRARTGSPGDERASAQVEWQEALAGRLGDDAAALLAAARLHADATPLGDLHRLIDEIRRRERESAGGLPRNQWRELRGHLHLALAHRGSTVALSDLRETFEEAEDVRPQTFIAAVRTIGDASSLEALAAAYARIEDERWRGQLAAAWAAIVTREKVTARHPTMKRIGTRWPQVAQALSTTSRTTPRRTTRRRT